MSDKFDIRLSDLYISNFEHINEGWPPFANGRRREALETVALSGLPDSSDEQYRHFNMRSFFMDTVMLAEQPGMVCDSESHVDPTVQRRPDKTGIELTDAYRVVVYNGICREQGLTELSDGVVYGSLRAAAGAMPDTVEKYMDSAVGRHGDTVTALCRVFARDGAFVLIPPGIEADKPFHIDICSRAERPGTACFPRILIVAGEGAKAQIIFSCSDYGSHGMHIAALREVITAAGSDVDITEVSSIHPDSVAVMCNYSSQAASSRTRATSLWLRGGSVRINSVTGLVGKDAESTLYGLFMGNGQELCDINMKVFHDVPDCRSYEVVKGVVSGNATGSFTGTVYVAPDAQHTTALQQSRNLQLSDTSRIFTEPQLEIYADDVKCSHGATIGRLNEEEIYYMRQRGIGEQEARKLQLEGFVNDIVSHCAPDEACKLITTMATARISEL